MANNRRTGGAATRSKILLVISATVLCALSGGYAQTDPETVKSVSGASSASGAALDQFGEPVVGANVHVQIQSGNGKNAILQVVTVQTNERGRFTVQSGDGSRRVLSIKKSGYRFDRGAVDFKDNGGVKADKEGFIKFSETGAPVYTVQKTLPPQELVTKIFRMEFGAEPQERRLDLIKDGLMRSAADRRSPGLSELVARSGEIDEPGAAKEYLAKMGVITRDDATAQEDVQVTAVKSLDGKQYIVTVTVLDTSGGVVVTDEKIDQAPNDNYQTEAQITLAVEKSDKVDNDNKDKTDTVKKYLYVKGRGGQVYSRLEMSFLPRSEALSVTIQSYSNESGSRNLRQQEGNRPPVYNRWKFKENRRRVNKERRKVEKDLERQSR